MRKASESFAGGKMQKAYKQYGQAAKAYELAPEAPRERWGLALYTRAMFILSGDASGHVESDLDEGDRLVAAEEFAGRDRFRGLFLFARSKWRRQHEDLEPAQEFLTAARACLEESGGPIDALEIDREQARLGVDRKEWDIAEAAARKSVDGSPDPRQSIESRILLSEVFRSQERMGEVLATLEAAASLAFDTEHKEQLWDLKDRIAILKRNHPELETKEP
ncbi:MAG: hypothetical protein ACI97A_000137 [Planctomycetota bacterium]|jgi:hypothetical protein